MWGIGIEGPGGICPVSDLHSAVSTFGHVLHTSKVGVPCDAVPPSSHLRKMESLRPATAVKLAVVLAGQEAELVRI